MLSLDQASTIVDAALEKGAELGCAPLTAAVLDPGGHLLALKRQDGCAMLRPQIAQAKAWTALGMGVGSRALFDRANAAPMFFNALAALSDGRVIPVPGGVLIRDAGGALLGAVGISGDHPDKDEACAVSGVERAGLAAEAGAPSRH